MHSIHGSDDNLKAVIAALLLTSFANVALELLFDDGLDLSFAFVQQHVASGLVVLAAAQRRSGQHGRDKQQDPHFRLRSAEKRLGPEARWHCGRRGSGKKVGNVLNLPPGWFQLLPLKLYAKHVRQTSCERRLFLCKIRSILVRYIPGNRGEGLSVRSNCRLNLRLNSWCEGGPCLS